MQNQELLRPLVVSCLPLPFAKPCVQGFLHISGVKSILDIGRTLEYLETQGVCVATFGSTKQFPAFFSSKSGYESSCNVHDINEAAELVHTTFGFGLNNGMS